MWRWKEYQPGALEFTEQVVARLIMRSDIHGVMASDLIINPGEAVVYIRDGKIEDVMTQTRLENAGGGFFNWLKTKFDMGEDVQMLFLDTAPFDLEFPVNTTSKDYIQVQGKQVVRVQLSTDGAAKLINLMNRTQFYADKAKEKNFIISFFKGDYTRINRVLLKAVVQAMLSDEIQSMVLTNEVSKVNAADLRGNTEVIKQIETTATIELRKTFEMWGFQVLKAFTVWGKNAYDAMMEYHRQYSLGVEQWDLNQQTQHMGNLAKMRREYELRRQDQEQRWDYEYGEMMGREGLKTGTLKEDLHRQDLTVDAQQGQQNRTTQGDVLRSGLVHDEKVRQSGTGFDEGYRQTTKTHDEDVRYTGSKGNVELDLKRKAMMDEVERDKLELEMAMKAKEQLHGQKLAETKQDQDFKTQQMSMQTGSTERIMAKALDTGAADSAALREMMRQQSMQKMADRESDKVKSVSEADAARYHMETYEKAQDRDRDYQLKMAGQSADLMQSAKPNVPQTLVQGGGNNQTATVVHAGDGVRGPGVQGGGMPCPHCGGNVMPGWKACPACGEKVMQASNCPNCNMPTKPGWKACPGCGNKL